MSRPCFYRICSCERKAAALRMVLTLGAAAFLCKGHTKVLCLRPNLRVGQEWGIYMSEKKWDVYVYGDVNIDIVIPNVNKFPAPGQEEEVPEIGRAHV